MLICPKCKCEYQEGYKTCSDCKCDLIEVPDPVANKSLIRTQVTTFLTVILFIGGIILIYYSPLMSFRLTDNYFIPGGTGIYNGDHYSWMLNAYQHSFLLIGGSLCLAGLICLIFSLLLLVKKVEK